MSANGEARGWRDGYKPRTLMTLVDELDFMVLKDRDGEFQTELFERYQRSPVDLSWLSASCRHLLVSWRL